MTGQVCTVTLLHSNYAAVLDEPAIIDGQCIIHRHTF